MANFIHNRIICSKDTLEKYFLDENPFDDDKPMEKPWISFRKLFNYDCVTFYAETRLFDSSNGFRYKELKEDVYEITFCTRNEIPYEAIVKALELDQNLEWFWCHRMSCNTSYAIVL